VDNVIAKEVRDNAWKYFALHADQRLRTFQFYIALGTVIIGASATLLDSGNSHTPPAMLLLLLAFFSFVFWRLDVRNKQLIKYAEAALKNIEIEAFGSGDEMTPDPLQLFLYEEQATSEIRKRWWRRLKHFSYSKTFNCVFLLLGVGGLMGALALFLAA
jgi:hypothetical protein